MRPNSLEIEGFAAFRERTVIDFEGRELVAFTGPTGAGKSSIIDGVAFALYGSVARYGKENLIAPIINTLSNEARVHLDFSIGKDRYSAVRIVRRTPTGASTKEARLEQTDGQGPPVVLAGTAAEVTREVEALLGLSFAQFTKTIVLPQGDFARFLTETSGDRQGLLRRLLGLDVYASMGATARRRSKEATIEADATRQALGNIEIVTDAAITRLTNAVDNVAAALDEASTAHTELLDAMATRDLTADGLERVEESLALLDATTVPEDAAAYGSDIEAADKAVATATARVNKTDAKRIAAAEAFDALTSTSEIDERIALRDKADELKRSCSELDAETKAAAAALANAQRASESIEAQLATARDELAQTRLAAGAAGIAATLSVGDNCPVCTQVIDELPEAHDHDVSQLESLVAQAEAAAAQARTDAVEASTTATTAQLAAVAAHNSLDDITDQLVDVATRSQLKAMAKKSETAKTKLDAATAQAATANDDLESAVAARALLEDRAAELRHNFVQARDAVSFLDPAVPSHDEVHANWVELAEWGAAKTAELATEQKALMKKSSENAKELAALRKKLVRFTKPFDININADATGETIYAQLAKHRDTAVAARDDAIFRQKRDAENAERVVALEEESVVATELGRLLNAKGFEQWLMADVMVDLAERATGRLSVLSSGAYSLTTDGSDFAVVDHRNADEERSARTLSGGETFLASLALALALAESITEMASTAIPPTESVFLDEGFGTLDGETLDVVASAIEELGASGRLVCIVTHISELAARIPQHVRVLRSPTGSVVEQSEEES